MSGISRFLPPRLRQKLTNNLNDQHFNEIIRGSFSSFLIRIIGRIMGYVFVVFVTRNFGSGLIGMHALSITLLSIVTVVGKLGMNTAVMRFVAEYSAQRKWARVGDVYNRSLKILLPLNVALVLVFFFNANGIAHYIFNKEYLAPFFKIIAFAIAPKVILLLHSGCIRGIKKIKEYAFLENAAIPSIATVILIVYLLFDRNNRYVSVLSYTASVYIVSIFSVYLWKRTMKLNRIALRSKIDKDEKVAIKELFSVAFPMLFTHSLTTIMGWIDIIMLGIFRTESEVGIYHVVLKISLFTTIVLLAINSIAAPKFAELYGLKNMSGFEQIARRATKLLFWATVPIVIVIFAFPTKILGFFGVEFKIGLHALLILTFGQFINAISGPVGNILQMTGHQKTFRNIIVIATVLNVVLNIILIPRYGINGAAIASLTSKIFWNITSVIYVKYFFGFITLPLSGIRKVKNNGAS